MPITRHTLAALAMMTASAAAQDAVTVEMAGLDGEAVGTLELTQTPNGVLVRGQLAGLPPGMRAFHFHETGACEPPFESAGDHFDPDGAEHGYHAGGGPHAGDMPNIHVGDDGSVTIEIFNPRVTLAAGQPHSLVDGDGTALVIHDGADDYESQPAGDAGDRIACGAIR
jgi:Cu-Zn family superoxide dismutase